MTSGSTPLAATDPLPLRPRRVLVTGCTGSGKTTLARSVADVLGVPHHELDALFHGPGWTPRPEFATDVAALAATERWVTEWQYSAVRPLLLARADLLVWLDLTRAQVARQLVPRTVHRRLRRVELWNGNVEPPLWTVFTDPDHLFRWGWRTFGRTAERVAEVLAAPGPPVVVRLRGRRDVRTWLHGPLQDAAGR
ncbi:AAA family ATPase [Pseudonocardia hydrocarbonoxydans]|uniref:Adenylate kinase n=1 Tax=Pseudonocardia hydrocarbonoxydans TaxID=76726 RepID=A0A4Y3WIR6_9PSEU|nr:AAA family ATPase [Pseudonocardia hydrocarbonoxydans]GEC17789.1 adenylate kinase [Pseudonocardia hydrocarbonoxydans]